MKYKWMLKNVQLRTPEKDDYKAAQEVADALKKSKKFDGTKIFLCRQVAGIAVPKGEKQDPYVHSFAFVSNDKDELQKLADNFNKILFPNHEKDELLGVNVRKNTDNYEDVFESKKIKTEESSDFRDELADKYYDNAKKLADEVLQEFYNGFKNYFEVEDEQGYSAHGDFHDGYSGIIELFDNISDTIIKFGNHTWTKNWEEIYDDTFKPFKQKLDELKKLINQASKEYKEYEKNSI